MRIDFFFFESKGGGTEFHPIKYMCIMKKKRKEKDPIKYMCIMKQKKEKKKRKEMTELIK